MHYLKKISLYSILLGITFLISCSGEDGAVGPSGLNSLIQTMNEPIGSNCEFGGIKIESGIDYNSNGTLEANEVSKTDYVCSTAGKNSLVNVVDEPAGVICTNGGIKIESGIDLDGDGILDNNEIQITRFICNGVNGQVDEQIRLRFTYTGNTSSTTGFIGGDLIDFDKNYFVGVDSIVFTSDPHIYDVGTTSLLELYNMTDDTVIANSLITSTNLEVDREYLMTGNLIDDLPNKAIRLGIRCRSQINGKSAASGNPYLFLYRRN